jgi:GntR family transcriptional regulator
MQAAISRMATVFDRVPIPLYLQLADLMRQRIAKGVWPRGRAVPTIEKLMEEFDVARVTVRQAIQLLAQEGLLLPQRGRGTFVTAEPSRERRLLVHTSLDDLVEMYRGDTPDLSHIVETRDAPMLLEQDGLAAPGYHHLRRVHSRAGERYCVVSLYIDDRVFAIAPERFRNEVAIPLLATLPGIEIARARQSLHIATADMEIARELQVPVNSPVGEVRRIFNAPDGSVLYLAEATYRGDYIRFEMNLKP